MAIHDINLALRFSDSYLLLHGGMVLASGGREVISPENIEDTYGVRVRVEGSDGEMTVTPVMGSLRRVTHDR
jgi:iron complex transport system ATP-binding protein